MSSRFDVWLNQGALPTPTQLNKRAKSVKGAADAQLEREFGTTTDIPENYAERLQACLEGMHCAFKAAANGIPLSDASKDMNVWNVLTDIGRIHIHFTAYLNSEGEYVNLAHVILINLRQHVKGLCFKQIIMHAILLYCQKFNMHLMVLSEMEEVAQFIQALHSSQVEGGRDSIIYPEAIMGIKNPFEANAFFIPRCFVKNNPVAEYLFRRLAMNQTVFPVIGAAVGSVEELNYVDADLGKAVVQAIKFKTTSGWITDGKPLLREKPFIFTRLDPWMLPSGHSLTTGHGEMIAERDARFKANARAAYRGVVNYEERLMKDWMRASNGMKPNDKFRNDLGDVISSTYLLSLEYLFRTIHYACRAQFWKQEDLGPSYKSTFVWEGGCDIAVVKLSIVTHTVESTDKKHVVEVDHIIIRGCAEGFGFFRLILNEIARNCAYFDANMRVKKVTGAAWDTIQRSFIRPSDAKAIVTHGNGVKNVEIPAANLNNSIKGLGIGGKLIYDGRIKIPGIQRRSALLYIVQEWVMQWLFKQPRNRKVHEICNTLQSEIIMHSNKQVSAQVLLHVTHEVLKDAIKEFTVTTRAGNTTVRPNKFKALLKNFN
jgi:hypothetical protein